MQSLFADKENEEKPKQELENTTKTYSKKTNDKNAAALKQKVLSAKNGSLTVAVAASEQAATDAAAAALQAAGTPIKMENGEASSEVKEEIKEGRPWGLCSGPADADSCVVHSTILPRTYWSYYSTVEEVKHQTFTVETYTSYIVPQLLM